MSANSELTPKFAKEVPGQNVPSSLRKPEALPQGPTCGLQLRTALGLGLAI